MFPLKDQALNDKRASASRTLRGKDRIHGVSSMVFRQTPSGEIDLKTTQVVTSVPLEEAAKASLPSALAQDHVGAFLLASVKVWALD
jgi:hypothetical protein